MYEIQKQTQLPNLKAISYRGHVNENDVMDATTDVTAHQLKPLPTACALLTRPSRGLNDIIMKHAGANRAQSHNAAVRQALSCCSRILLVMRS